MPPKPSRPAFRPPRPVNTPSGGNQPSQEGADESATIGRASHLGQPTQNPNTEAGVGPSAKRPHSDAHDSSDSEDDQLPRRPAARIRIISDDEHGTDEVDGGEGASSDAAVVDDDDDDDDDDGIADSANLLESSTSSSPVAAPAAATNLPSASQTGPGIPRKFLSTLMHQHFDDSKTRLESSAMTVVQKYVDIFAREAIARAAAGRECDGNSFLEIEDLEKMLPQLLMDFN